MFSTGPPEFGVDERVLVDVDGYSLLEQFVPLHPLSHLITFGSKFMVDELPPGLWGESLGRWLIDSSNLMYVCERRPVTDELLLASSVQIDFLITWLSGLVTTGDE